MHNCKVCKTETSKIEEVKKTLTYYRCVSCGFIYLEDKYVITQEKEKERYTQHENAFENKGYIEMFEKFIIEAVEPYIADVKTVLDFGCGEAPVLAKLLEKRNLEVDAYDIYFATKKVYEAKTYDLITSTEVFEHLQKPMETLELLADHLTNNGYIILMTRFPPKDDKTFLNWWYRRDSTHISFFTPKSFEVMAEKVGLKVLKILNKNIVVFQKL
jgi:cyclopropane fatty-acyl-phospholipid synthase-like methyltransferase